ncbi:MAG: hypothetical protein HFH34_01465 [Eubacterium sp.]|jgi:hypothetical protein|nr:hypothetical protein [Eubacterium sp.]
MAAGERSMLLIHAAVYAVNENSLLAAMNPFCLLAGAALVCILAWYCAKRYQNTNDFKKSVYVYVPCVIFLDLLLLFVLEIDALLCIGLDLCGLIVMALISNHYFYS